MIRRPRSGHYGVFWRSLTFRRGSAVACWTVLSGRRLEGLLTFDWPRKKCYNTEATELTD